MHTGAYGLNHNHFLGPVVVAVVFWIVLTDGALHSWLVGAPAVMISTWAYLRLNNRGDYGVQWLALCAFIPWFILQSIRGGIEVAKLALRIKGVEYSKTFSFPIGIHGDRERVFFANCVNLLPGTAAIGFSKQVIEIHTVIPVDAAWRETFELQCRVADVFDVDIDRDVSQWRSASALTDARDGQHD